jgi:hypothetical protein
MGAIYGVMARIAGWIAGRIVGATVRPITCMGDWVIVLWIVGATDRITGAMARIAGWITGCTVRAMTDAGDCVTIGAAVLTTCDPIDEIVLTPLFQRLPSPPIISTMPHFPRRAIGVMMVFRGCRYLKKEVR